MLMKQKTDESASVASLNTHNAGYRPIVLTAPHFINRLTPASATCHAAPIKTLPEAEQPPRGDINLYY